MSKRTRRQRLPAPCERITIESLAHDGRGVAHRDGKAVFIDGALPGEEIGFEYLATHRKYDEGRVTARGQREKPDPSTIRYAELDRPVVPNRNRPVHFDGHGWLDTLIVDRNGLTSNDEIAGPCIIEELDSTIVLDPDARAQVDDVGNIVITVGHSSSSGTA